MEWTCRWETSFGHGAEVGSGSDVTDETQIREAGRRFSSEVPDGKVILFGSHARGDAGDRSDLDIRVIKPEVENAGLEAVGLVRELRDRRLPLENRRRQRKRCRGLGQRPRKPRACGDHRGATPHCLMVDHSDPGRELMSLANDDRAPGAILLDIVGVADAIVAFHAQQAVEESLKGRPSIEPTS